MESTFIRGMVVAGRDWGQGCSVGVTLGGRKGGGEVSVITISHLAVIGCRCRSMQSRVASSFSIAKLGVILDAVNSA